MRFITVAAALAAIAILGPSAAAAAPGHAYVVHFSPQNIVDTGAKGLSAGDLIVSHDVLFRGGKRVGRAALTCTITDPKAPEGVCSVTWALPDGTVSGQFLNSPPPRKVVAITGGTGAYLGARGQAVVVESAKNQTGTLRFSFLG
jgi:hypothetical protein